MTAGGEAPEPSSEQKQAIQIAVSTTLPLTALDEEQSAWGKFANGLSLALSQRRELHGLPDSEPSYFCYVTRPNEFAHASGGAHFFDLELDPTVAVSNRLLLVSENGNGGIGVAITGQADVLNRLDALNLAGRPCAVYYPAKGLVRFFPTGFTFPEEQFDVGLHPPRTDITEEDILHVIDLFHSNSLCTPQHVAPVFWENPSKWVPVGEAEKTLQWPLKTALVLGFQKVALIKPEEPNAVGDADFTIYRLGRAVDDPPAAIVEVKVQKSARANGAVQPNETRKEYARGLIQTAGYRNQTGAALGLLACFDLREPGFGTDAAWASAQKRTTRVCNRLNKIAGGRPSVVTWQVFANTEEAQAAATAGPLRTADPLYPVTKRTSYKAQLTA